MGRLAALVLGGFALGAAAQDHIDLNSSGIGLSLPLSTTRTNFVSVFLYTGSTPGPLVPIVGRPVTFTASQGCGTFGGNQSAIVNTGLDGMAYTPAFTSTNIDFLCSISASALGSQGTITNQVAIHVYDPAYTKVAFIGSNYTAGVGEMIFVAGMLQDHYGNGLPSELVTFSSPADCVSGLSPPLEVTTQIAGHTYFNVVAAAGTHQCTIQAAAEESPGVGTLNLTIYDPADVIGTPTVSPLQTVVNQAFSFGIKLTAKGFPLSGIAMGAHMPVSGAGGSLQYQEASTDATGTAYFNGVANAIVGNYSIVLDLPQRPAAMILNVVQSAVAPPPPPPPPLGAITDDIQDMWWAGSDGNGWGMSLIQHGDRIFAQLYVYDANGRPIWYAMPGGTWDSTHTIITGALYSPHGSPYYAYDVSKFSAGASVGTLMLTFRSKDDITLDYTIGGAAGHLFLTRELFGPTTGANGGAHGDMWWAGSTQNGWGVAILEQPPVIFPIWFTYDANGNPTWFVVPVGSFQSSAEYVGSVYKTTSSPWYAFGLGTYDASKLQSTNVGSFSIQFVGDSAALSYTVEGHSGTALLVREPF